MLRIVSILVLPLLVLPALLAAPSGTQAAATECTRLLPTGGREVIINMCDKCRVVHITRLRAGNSLPMSRTYNVQPKSKIDLSFRGPGRSRITAELPCKGDPGAPVNLTDPDQKKASAKNDKKCVAMEQAPGGGVQLVNSCEVCKAALIERQDAGGANGRRQAYKVAPKTPVPVPPNGAAKVALLAEVPCP